MKIFYMTFISLVFCFVMNAQVWVPAGAAFPTVPSATTVHNNELYVAYFNTDSSTLEVAKWNTFFWAVLGRLPYEGLASVNSMKFYQNELYLGGYFDSIPSIPTATTVIRFDGQNWKSAGTGDPYGQDIFSPFGPYVNDLEVYQGKLYAGGNFQKAGTDSAANLALWDGSEWQPVRTSDSQMIYHVTDILVHADTLYILDQIFVTINNIWATHLETWNGSKWDTVGHILKLSGQIMYEYQDTIFTSGFEPNLGFGTTDYYYNGIWRHLNNETASSFAEHKGNLWSAGWGPDTVFYTWTGMEWAEGPSLMQADTPSYPIVFTFEDNLYTYSFYGTKHSDKQIYRLYYDSLSLVSGLVYYDINKNCEKDPAEEIVEQALIEVSPINHFMNVNSSGKYLAVLYPGNFQITLHKKYWEINSCQSDTLSIQLQGQSRVDTLDFAISPVPGIRDLRTNITGFTGFRARRGFTETYKLDWENTGTDTITGASVKLNFPAGATLDSVSLPYDNLSGNEITWNLDPLAMFDKGSLTITFEISNSLAMGDSLCFSAFISPVAGDSFPPDNYDTLCQRIVASYDPNDKQSSPEGNIAPDTRKIDYLIRFQNTGTDTAYKVVIVDTVDANLPLTELVMNNSSHPYSLEIRNNTLIWTFDNILLPDSHINEPKSHGFIRYTAGIRPGIAVGDTILNRAYIYFDYNSPIITNQTVSVVKLQTGINEPEEVIPVPFAIYPNPAQDVLHIRNTAAKGRLTLHIYDVTGRLWRQLEMGREEITLNIEHFPPGMYFVRDIVSGANQKVIIK
ncbi:MAG: T9SS type A sorting domain-containing protein [Bacteroidia bacterium]